MAKKNESNVDRIRDIIFGSQMKESEAKFSQVHSDMGHLEERFATLFNESHDKLRKETERSLEVLETKIDNLVSIAQKDKTKLKNMIDTTEETLQDRLTHQQDEFNVKLKTMKENAFDEQQKLKAAMNSMKAEIDAALREGLTTLSDDTVSRESMAQMLIDVAMKVQRTDVDDVLSEGEETGK